MRTNPNTLKDAERKYFRDPASRRRIEEMTAKILIRQQLIDLRKKRGLTQKQLAARMGVTQPVVAELESAAPRNIELRTLVRAALALGATLTVELKPVEGAVPNRTHRGPKRKAA
jgi:transcriptional regulator with XRE-family HTH domain